MKVSIVIPAYNEEATIEAIVRRVQAVDLGAVEKEIIVVNDGSKDKTDDVLKRLSGIMHISHECNGGKGAALATGFKSATGDILLIQDADLEYDPNDYLTVIKPIMDGRSDVVMGSRFSLYKPKFIGKRRSPYLSHYIGNMLIRTVSNILYWKNFTDYEGCYKAFRCDVVTTTSVTAKGFEFDNELICKLMRKKTRIVEVPIHYTPRTYEFGKKITWMDGLIIIWTIIKWRFLPMGLPGRAATVQAIIGLLLLVLVSLFSTVKMTKPTEQFLKRFAGVTEIVPDSVTMSGQRFAPLRSVLPKHGTVGYVTDEDMGTYAAYDTYLGARYALAPVLVEQENDPRRHRPLVVGNLTQPATKLRKFLQTHQLEVVYDAGNGVLLLESQQP